MAHETFSRQEQPQGSNDREFGVVFSGFFLFLAALNYFGKLPFSFDPATITGCPFWSAYPELADQALTLSLAAASAIFLLFAVAIPKALAPLNWVWTRFGLVLHKIVSPVVLGVLFFLVFTPIGLIIRLFGNDPLHLRFDSQAQSYWIVRSPSGPEPDSLKNQF
ncbi:MAG: SxtJ family membrane protein [Proteobacteria bacterium]|nr:SxtJ family membrane protein [Pseudomonadota bacterium]